MGAYYFLMCLLPPLPSRLGEPLPAPFSELSLIARRNVMPDDEALLRGQLSLIDTGNFENRLQGRDLFVAGGNLSREDLAAGRNLPGFVRIFLEEQERGLRRAYPPDRLWELAYGALLQEAAQAGCASLLGYLPWEIGLRNALALQRLRERGEAGEGRLVLPQESRFDFTALMARLAEAQNPLLREQALDDERLKRIRQCQGADPFSLDALLAYLSSSVIYERWQPMGIPYDMNQYLYGGG